MAGAGRFGRRRAGSVYAGQSVDLDQAVLTLDLLRALGWLVRHGVPWPERPGQEIEHVLVGPPGVFVLIVDTDQESVEPQAPGIWKAVADEALTAATDVARALPGVPVTPVLCFTRAEPFTGVAGQVFLCSLRNVVEVLSHAPVRLDDATLAAARHEVADGLGTQVHVAPVAALPRTEPSEAAAAEDPADDPGISGGISGGIDPGIDPGADLELRPTSNYDLYAELGRLDDPLGDATGAASDRMADEVVREQERIETEQMLTPEAVAAAEAARLEEERREAERLDAEHLAALEVARIEDARRAAERAEAERRAAEEAERLAAERAEAERLAAEQAEQAEQERLAAEEAERQRLAAEAEAERLAAEQAEQAEQERLAAEEAERQRLAAEAEAERLAAEQAEQERLAAEEAEAERLAAEAEAERLAAEQAEQERLAAEEAEAERLAAEAETERLAAEQAEQERLAAEEAEAERLAAEQAEQERLAAEEAERQRLAAEAETERLAAEQAERAERERLAAEQAERERFAAEAEQAEAARRAAEQRLIADRVAAERVAAERAEEQRLAAGKREQERLAAERVAAAEAARIEHRHLASTPGLVDVAPAAVVPPEPVDPQKAAELATAQKAVEAARARKARLQQVREPRTEPGESTAPVAAEEPRRRSLPQVPTGTLIKVAAVVGALVVAGFLLQGPIGTVRDMFSERPAARMGEQVNVTKTLYHPELRLRAGQPVPLPRRGQVAIPFTVTTDGAAWDLEATDLVLLDRIGISHQAEAGPPIREGKVLGARTPVPAGGTVTGYLLFDLPRDTTVKELRLTLAPEEADEDPVVWFTREP